MRSVTLRLDDLRTTILNLGYVGENEHTRFIFDCKRMFDQYPSASASLTVAPPAGESYPAVIERDGDLVTWVITDSDLIHDGCGEIQLSFTESETVAKTFIARTKVSRSLVPAGEIPEGIDDFLTRAGAVLTAIPETIEEALADAKASGEFDGPPGEPGQDGYSPTATVSKSGKTATITITDKNGTTTAQISDGEIGGTSDYSDLENKPQIAGVTLSGNVSLHDLGAAAESAIPDPTSIIDDTAGDGDTNKVWSADKSSSLLTEINSRYIKPNTGIPATDMASSVQTSLNNADSAYQKPQTGIPATDMAEGVIPDITGKADKTVTDALQKNKAPVIIDSAEWNPIVLTDGADGLPIESMKIHFLPKQDTSGGDPSPSHVCPISGWTGLTAWRTGKNLLALPFAYYRNAATSIENYFFIKAGTYIFRFAESNADSWRYIVRLKDKNGDDLSDNAHNPSETISYRSSVKGYTNGTNTTQKSIVLTIVEDCFIRLLFWNTGSTETTFSECQLETGSTASQYAEYAGQSYPVTFPDGQTVYGGTLDAVNGVLKVDRAMVDLGTLSPWYKISTQSPHWRFWTYLNTAKVNGTLLSSDYVQITPSAQYKGAEGVATQTSGDNVLVMVSDERYEEVNTFASAMSGVQLVYELATPIEIPLDPITVQTLIGDNVIWSDANGTIELDYRADTKLWISGHSTTVDSALSDTSENPVQNKVIKTALDAKEPKHNTTTVSGSTPTITGVENTRYICGECSTLTITAPASGCIDVVFESGSTPTVLTVSSAKTGVTAIKWANGFDPTALEANTTYEINILDGEFGVVGKWT